MASIFDKDPKTGLRGFETLLGSVTMPQIFNPTNKQLIDAAILRGSLELLKPKQPGENLASQASRSLDAMKLVEEGKGTDEVISILQQLKKTRKDNAGGGINTLMASDDMNERLLEKLYEDFLEQGFSPEEASRKAREAFNERVNVANGGGLQYLMGM